MPPRTKRTLLAQRLVRVMQKLKTGGGLLKQARVNHAPELVSSSFEDECEEYGIEVVYIQKSKPQQSELARASTARSVISA